MLKEHKLIVSSTDNSFNSYSEAIDILYSHNIFSFDYVNNILMLPRSMLAHRLNLINSVQFSLWYGGGTYVTGERFEAHEWEVCWRIIASMQGLRELRVTIKLPFILHGPHVPLKHILDPLRAVKGTKIFEVSVPGSEEEYWMESRDAPFVLKRDFVRFDGTQ